MKIAGLDIGTTGCKLTVFDGNGLELGKSYRDYPVKRNVGGHEIDVAALMDGVYAVISDIAAKYPDISGIGVTSFGETFVMTDEATTTSLVRWMAKPPLFQSNSLSLTQSLP